MNANCENCPVHNLNTLQRMGIEMKDFDFVVALMGNPNTGKSTVFNALTGLKQHTGNWPGKTVTRSEGGYIYGTRKFKIVDLPGTYSLLSMSADEEVARNFLLFGKPDVTVIVADATRLERNLNLVFQVLEITERAILCINLIDEAERHGIQIDERRLAKKLGIPVIKTAAREKRGTDELLYFIDEVATGSYKCNPNRATAYPPEIEKALIKVEKLLLGEFPYLPNTRWIALRLLEGDQSIIETIESNDIQELIQQNEMQSA